MFKQRFLPVAPRGGRKRNATSGLNSNLAPDIFSVITSSELCPLSSLVDLAGLGHHSEMSYRKLRPVRQFLRWLRSQDDEQVLSRSMIGGFFMYPPPPVSLETYMKDRRGRLSAFTSIIRYFKKVSFYSKYLEQSVCVRVCLQVSQVSCEGRSSRGRWRGSVTGNDAPSASRQQ